MYTHNHVIITCYVLHNLIRQENVINPLDEELETIEAIPPPMDRDSIISIKPTDAWSTWRDPLANVMYSKFRTKKGRL